MYGVAVTKNGGEYTRVRDLAIVSSREKRNATLKELEEEPVATDVTYPTPASSPAMNCSTESSSSTPGTAKGSSPFS